MSTTESLVTEPLQSIFIENVMYLHVEVLTHIMFNYFCQQLGELQFLLLIHQYINPVSYQCKCTEINDIIIAIKEDSIVWQYAKLKNCSCNDF